MARFIEVPLVAHGLEIRHQVPGQEPVFHFVQRQGSHGIADLATVKSWVRSSIDEGVPLDEYTTDLYVLLPGGQELVRCVLTQIETDGGPGLEVEAVDPGMLNSGVVYTCKL